MLFDLKKNSHPNFIFRRFIEFLREVSHEKSARLFLIGGCIDS